MSDCSCYLCAGSTAADALPSGVRVCGECAKREGILRAAPPEESATIPGGLDGAWKGISFGGVALPGAYASVADLRSTVNVDLLNKWRIVLGLEPVLVAERNADEERRAIREMGLLLIGPSFYADDTDDDLDAAIVARAVADAFGLSPPAATPAHVVGETLIRASVHEENPNRIDVEFPFTPLVEMCRLICSICGAEVDIENPRAPCAHCAGVVADEGSTT